MKIGILTYHWVYNFGANLQTLSTISFLRNEGYDPVVINWVPQDLQSVYEQSTDERQKRIFQDFQQQYYPSTPICRTAEDIARCIREYNIEKIFIGADTLFILRKKKFGFRRLKFYHPTSNTIFPNPFWGQFLDYVPEIPVVGYSIASLDTVGTDFVKQKNDIADALFRFEKLTVRDRATADLVSYFTDHRLVPSITPDPVFNFNRNFHFDEIEKDILAKLKLPEHYVLLCLPEYFQHRFQSWVATLAELFKRQGKTLLELPRQTGVRCFDIDQLADRFLSPLEWYAVIKHAECYVGGLMHPIVACIHNKIPFYSLDYYGVKKYKLWVKYETSKIYQILQDCNLLDYYSNIGSMLSPMPDVHEVFDKLLSFDKAHLCQVSERKREESYSTMLDVIK